MATGDDAQLNTDERTGMPRTFKSKDVHRRRAAKAASRAEGRGEPHGDALPAEGDASAEDGAPVARGMPSESGSSVEGSVQVEDGLQASAGARAEDGAQDEGGAPDERDAQAEGGEPEGNGPGSESEGDEPAGDEPVGDEVPRRPPRRPRIRAKHVIVALAVILVIAVVGLCSAFAWDRWGRYDDHADMQGQWYVAGTTVPVEVGERVIELTEDVSYEYELDDHAKTLEYTFGPMSGGGRYWFSADRRFLAITDGEGYTGVRTVLEDLAHLCTDIVEGGGPCGTRLPEGEGVIVFCREPGQLAQLVEDAAARVKARAVQEKRREQQELARKQAAEEAEGDYGEYGYDPYGEYAEYDEYGEYGEDAGYGVGDGEDAGGQDEGAYVGE